MMTVASDPSILRSSPAVWRRVARISAPYVLSVYIDLDPTEFGIPKARQSQVTSTLGDLTARIDGADLPHEVREAARADVDILRRRFGGETIDDAQGAQALGVFISGAANLFDVVRIYSPVRAGWALDSEPFLEPVAHLLDRASWCVMLVDRSVARFFIGEPDRLEEIETVEDQVHRQHAQGGWSQANYQRSVEKDVENHLARTAQRARALLERFENLIIGCPVELYPHVEAALHADVLRCLRGRVTLDVQNVSTDDVMHEIQPVIEQWEAAVERDVLDRLREELGRHGRAAASPAEVRRALEDRRVEVLLLEDPEGASEEIDLALEQSADVLVVRHHDDLSDLGHIAALLRFLAWRGGARCPRAKSAVMTTTRRSR